MATKMRTEKKNLADRACRAAGQARAIERMLEEDVYCIDVLTQIAATRAALLSLARAILKDHMSTCVVEALKGGDAERAIREIDATLARFIK